MTSSSLWGKCLINWRTIISSCAFSCILCQIYPTELLRNTFVIELFGFVLPRNECDVSCSKLDFPMQSCLFIALEEQKGLKQIDCFSKTGWFSITLKDVLVALGGRKAAERALWRRCFFVDIGPTDINTWPAVVHGYLGEEVRPAVWSLCEVFQLT